MTTTVAQAASDSTFGGTNVPAQYQNQILVSAQRWGISPAILAAQLNQESSFNPSSVSPDGAVGIAQFLPSTAKEYGVDPYNVSSAIDGMAKLDATYLKQFGSIDKALAAYNAGGSAVSKYGGIPPYAETQQYVRRILAAAGSAVSTGDTTGGLVDEVKNNDPLKATGNLVANLLKPAWWTRFGVGALGVAVILVAVYFMMAKEPGSFAPLRRIGKEIAK